MDREGYEAYPPGIVGYCINSTLRPLSVCATGSLPNIELWQDIVSGFDLKRVVKKQKPALMYLIEVYTLCECLKCPHPFRRSGSYGIQNSNKFNKEEVLLGYSTSYVIVVIKQII